MTHFISLGRLIYNYCIYVLLIDIIYILDTIRFFNIRYIKMKLQLK